MSEQRAQPGQQQEQPARADLSRDELRAHLANVESQIKSTLRIIASESKGSKQAHSALRADLTSALLRLQADMNGSASELNSKVDHLGAEISFLNRQRQVGRAIFLTFGMSLSFILGVLVIVSWLMIKEGAFQNTGIPLPIEEMFGKNPQSAAPASPSQSAPPVPVTRQSLGIGVLPLPVQRPPLSAQKPPPLQLVPGTPAPPAVPAQSQAQPELPASIFKRNN
jgi:hypothetical protein